MCSTTSKENILMTIKLKAISFMIHLTSRNTKYWVAEGWFPASLSVILLKNKKYLWWPNSNIIDRTILQLQEVKCGVFCKRDLKGHWSPMRSQGIIILHYTRWHQQPQFNIHWHHGAVRGTETVSYYTTWWCHRCAPGKISACAPGCCTQLPHRRRNRLFPWRPCSTGCCGTDVPGIRTPTPVSGGNWGQFCQPCPHFRVGLSVAVT